MFDRVAEYAENPGAPRDANDEIPLKIGFQRRTKAEERSQLL